MFNLGGEVVRVCLSCGAIYRDSGKNLTFVKPCKKCERTTGFFESMGHLYLYIENYGIDTDNIMDVKLKEEIEAHYA
jgi:hypothetical protein